MSTLQINEKDAKGKQNGVITDVTFLYVSLQSAKQKYQSKEKEYVLSAVVDKATRTKFKKQFPKNTPKDIETEDFEGKFKTPPPYPKQEEQYIIKFAVSAELGGDVKYVDRESGEPVEMSKGEMIPYSWAGRPKAFMPTEEEGKVKDITLTSLVGNGSKGTVAFDIITNDYGTFPRLTGILVTDLVEYEGGGGSASPFGEVEGGLNEPKKTKPKQKDDDDEDDDEDYDPEENGNPFDADDDD